jgi:UDP-N-acetyl-2-amino-2-deoxyglucuronate dehydrogenase
VGAADPVALGSIGLGWWGGELAEAVERSGRARIVTCFSRTEEARLVFAERHGCRAAGSLDEVLADDEVEGLLIATPHSTHEDMVVAAAEAGKHVLIEKPLTLTVAAGRRAIEAAGRAGIVLQVGHHRRRLAATRALKQIVDAGELGMVHLLEANLSLPGALDPKPGWRNDPRERPLGGMTALGVHMADNLCYLVGPVARVSAFSRPLLARGSLDDVTTCILEFESGALGYLGTSLVVPKIGTLAVYGTGGAAWSEEDGARLFRQDMGETSRREQPLDAVDGLAEQLAEFATCIRTGARPEVGGEEALQIVAILEAAMESCSSDRPVALKELRA